MSKRFSSESILVKREPVDFARIFKPVEHAVLARFLRRPKLLPEWAAEVDLDELPREGWDESAQGIAPLKPINDPNVLENTAARIALAPIQHRLPQWTGFNLSSKPVLGRTLRAFPLRKATSLPLLLFGINWATSGPGFDWPEQYHVTWIPHYNEYLVTASSDSTGVHGFEDIALGSFAPSSKRGADKKSIGDIISGHWHHLLWHGQETAWESLWRCGAIGHKLPFKWRDEVWPPEAEESEEAQESEEVEESKEEDPVDQNAEPLDREEDRPCDG